MGICFSLEEQHGQQLSTQQQQYDIHNNSSDKKNQGYGSTNPPAISSKCKSPTTKSACGTQSTQVPPKNVNDLRQSPGYSNVDMFTYNEMKLATKFFRPDSILGEGGFGVVYKGVIDENVRPGYKTTFVAIKELNRGGYQGDREWLAEVNFLGQLRHSNLVKLIGYCCEDEHRILVYEYMESGSLEKHLLRSKWLTFSESYGI